MTEQSDERESYSWDHFMDHIYDLDRDELRRLAFEALLISDGPAHIGEERPQAAAKTALHALDWLYKEIPTCHHNKVGRGTPHCIFVECPNYVRKVHPQGNCDCMFKRETL